MSRLFRTGRQLGFLVGEQKEREEDQGVVIKARSWPDEFVSSAGNPVGWVNIKTGHDRKIVGSVSALDASFVLNHPMWKMIENPNTTTVDSLLLTRFVNQAASAFAAFRALYNDIITLLKKDNALTWKALGVVCITIMKIAFSRASNVVERNFTAGDITSIADNVAKHIADKTAVFLPQNINDKLAIAIKIVTSMKGITQKEVKEIEAKLNVKLSMFNTATFHTGFASLVSKLIEVTILQDAYTGHALQVTPQAIGKIVPFQNSVHNNAGGQVHPLKELDMCVIIYPPCTLITKTPDEKTVRVFPFPSRWEHAAKYSRALVIPFETKQHFVTSFIPKKLLPNIDEDEPHDVMTFLKTFDEQATAFVKSQLHHLRKTVYISAAALRQVSLNQISAKDVIKTTSEVMGLYPLISFDERTIVFPFYKPFSTLLCSVELKVYANESAAHVHLHFCYLCGDDLYEPDQMQKLERFMVYRVINILVSHPRCIVYRLTPKHVPEGCKNCASAKKCIDRVAETLFSYTKAPNTGNVSRTFAALPGTYRDCMKRVLIRLDV